MSTDMANALSAAAAEMDTHEEQESDVLTIDLDAQLTQLHTLCEHMSLSVTKLPTATKEHQKVSIECAFVRHLPCLLAVIRGTHNDIMCAVPASANELLS